MFIKLTRTTLGRLQTVGVAIENIASIEVEGYTKINFKKEVEYHEEPHSSILVTEDIEEVIEQCNAILAKGKS